jgi:hypothetical protein
VLDPTKVSACLITRGDVDLEPILDSLPRGFDEVLIWGRERDEQPGTFGRYQLMREAKHDVIYTQDDDCVFEQHEMLARGWYPGCIAAVYGHGKTPGGYADVALVHGGALIDRDACLTSFDRYLEQWPRDEGFYREADMISGTITPSRQYEIPYIIRMGIAARPNRMAHQPWQADLKHKITERARQVRDGVCVA